MNISDGAAVQVTIIPDKVKYKIDENDWNRSFEKYSIISIPAKNFKI